MGETTPVAARIRDRVVPALQSILKRILRTGELRRRIVPRPAEPVMSDDVIEGENGYGSEYDSPFAQEEAENEATPNALAQSQQELSEGFGAARDDILELQAQMGEIMQVFSMLTEAVYNMPVSAEQAAGRDLHPMADTGIVPEAISAEIDDIKQQLETLESGLSKTDVAMLTVESMLSGYQVNKVDFLNLVRSQMTLLNYENQYWKSLTAANQALARLAAAVGEEAVHE